MTARQPDVAGTIHVIDQAMIALAVAKSALLGETSPPVPDLGSFARPVADKHGRYDAASAAEVAQCGVTTDAINRSFTCGRPVSHSGPHAADQGPGVPPVEWVKIAEPALACNRPGDCRYPYCNRDGNCVAEASEPIVITRDELLADWRAASPGACSCPGTGADPSCPQHGDPLCPAQWGEPPETMLCSLPSGHEGNHATAEGIEWGGRWETAEPGAHAEPAAGTSVNPTIPGRDCAAGDGRELWFCHGCGEFHAPAGARLTAGPGANGGAR